MRKKRQQTLSPTLAAATELQKRIGKPYKVYRIAHTADKPRFAVARSVVEALGLVAEERGYSAAVVRGNRKSVAEWYAKLDEDERAALAELMKMKPA